MKLFLKEFFKTLQNIENHIRICVLSGNAILNLKWRHSNVNPFLGNKLMDTLQTRIKP